MPRRMLIGTVASPSDTVPGAGMRDVPEPVACAATRPSAARSGTAAVTTVGLALAVRWSRSGGWRTSKFVAPASFGATKLACTHVLRTDPHESRRGDTSFGAISLSRSW